MVSMSTYQCTFVPTYIDGNRIPSAGFDTESIPLSAASLTIANQGEKHLGLGSKILKFTYSVVCKFAVNDLTSSRLSSSYYY